MAEPISRLDESHWAGFWALRERLFQELGELPQDAVALERATREFYLAHVNRDLFSWGIFSGEGLASVGSLCVFERLPYAGNLAGREGYILNIYTLPEYRKQGFAGGLLEEILSYGSSIGVRRLWLNSSSGGEALYRKKGFKKGGENELEKLLPSSGGAYWVAPEEGLQKEGWDSDENTGPMHSLYRQPGN